MQIKDLPKAALGIHKVQKVKILRTQHYPAIHSPSDEIDYAIVLLDNGAVFDLVPTFYCYTTKMREEAYAFLFSRDEKIVIMSEGETFEFV